MIDKTDIELLKNEVLAGMGVSSMPLPHSFITFIAGSSERPAKWFRNTFGANTIGLDPEKIGKVKKLEPKTDNPLEAVEFKLDRVLEVLIEVSKNFPLFSSEVIAILASDAVFENPKGEIQHKLSREKDIDLEKEMEELAVMYQLNNALEGEEGDEFITMRWQLGFGFMRLIGSKNEKISRKKVFLFEIKVQLKESLDANKIIKSGNKFASPGFDLIGMMNDSIADFFISNVGSDENILISHELAKLLIADKVLPLGLFAQLILSEPTHSELDGSFDRVLADFDTTELKLQSIGV